MELGLESVFELTFPKLENSEDKKLTFTIKKHNWENINKNNNFNTAFNFVKNSLRIKFDEKIITTIINEDNKVAEADKNIMKEKIINTINLLVSDDYTFENLKALYDEIQFEEKNLTIDFNNSMH